MSTSHVSVNVGLLSHNGLVGSFLLKYLLPAHQEGTINLVILHRSTTDLSTLPKDLETRLVDLSEGQDAKVVNEKAVNGLGIVISAIGGPGILSQKFLIDALTSSSTLKTFIHSDFGCNWTHEEISQSGLSILRPKEQLVEYAIQNKVPLTHVRIGALDRYFFDYGLGGVDLKNNKVGYFRQSLNNPVRITSLDYLGYALTQVILTSSPSSLANKYLQIYDLSPTGQEFVDVLSSIYGNGSKTELVPYSEEEYEKIANGPPSLGAIAAGLRRKWGDNDWGSEDSERVQVDGWNQKSLEEIVRGYIG